MIILFIVNINGLCLTVFTHWYVFNALGWAMFGCVSVGFSIDKGISLLLFLSMQSYNLYV